jgi:hypothetical protein
VKIPPISLCSRGFGLLHLLTQKLALNRHAKAVVSCLLLGEQRKPYARITETGHGDGLGWLRDTLHNAFGINV